MAWTAMLGMLYSVLGSELNSVGKRDMMWLAGSYMVVSCTDAVSFVEVGGKLSKNVLLDLRTCCICLPSSVEMLYAWTQGNSAHLIVVGFSGSVVVIMSKIDR